MGAADRPFITKLVEDVVKSQGLLPEFYWPPTMLEDELKESVSWGCFLNDELAAVVLLREMPDVGEISLLATAPDYRRKGCMEFLLRGLFDAIGHNREIWLEVHENNHQAQQLYKKLGFRRDGVRSHYYKDGGSAVLYSRSRVER
jgi:ribosomal-protein-alanine N-acetyltransferase